jgi:hypothetical protein
MADYRSNDVESQLRHIAANGDGKLQAAAQTLFTMREEERRLVVDATARLANSVPKLGPVTAFEVVAATARRMAKDGGHG